MPTARYRDGVRAGRAAETQTALRDSVTPWIFLLFSVELHSSGAAGRIILISPLTHPSQRKD